MKKLLRKYLQLLHGGDRGTVMITFLVSLPILLLVIGIIAQYTLLVNARLTVEFAAASAARTAMTALPTNAAVDTFDAEAYPTDPDYDQDSNHPDDAGIVHIDGFDCVNRTARLALEPLSPEAKSGPSAEAQAVGAALRTLGVKVPSTFEARYTSAESDTTVDCPPIDYIHASPRKVTITVHYKYYLSVPVIGRLMGTSDPALGMNYVTFNSSVAVQLTPSRETDSSSLGWAQ